MSHIYCWFYYTKIYTYDDIPEYKELLQTIPYFEDFVFKYESAYQKIGTPIITLPAEYYIWWFLWHPVYRRITLDFREHGKTIITITLCKTNGLLEIVSNSIHFEEEFSAKYKISTFREVCNIMFEEGPKLSSLGHFPISQNKVKYCFHTFKDKSYDLSHLYVNIFGNNQMNTYCYNSFGGNLPTSNYIDYDTSTIIVLRSHEEKSLNSCELNNFYQDKINYLLNNKTYKNSKCRWLASSKAPFAIYIYKIKFGVTAVESGIYRYGTSSHKDASHHLVPCYRIKYYYIHISIYEKYIKPHLDIIEVLNNGRWSKQELIQYAYHTWDIKGIQDPSELNKMLYNKINSIDWLNNIKLP